MAFINTYLIVWLSIVLPCQNRCFTSSCQPAPSRTSNGAIAWPAQVSSFAPHSGRNILLNQSPAACVLYPPCIGRLPDLTQPGCTAWYLHRYVSTTRPRRLDMMCDAAISNLSWYGRYGSRRTLENTGHIHPQSRPFLSCPRSSNLTSPRHSSYSESQIPKQHLLLLHFPTKAFAQPTHSLPHILNFLKRPSSLIAICKNKKLWQYGCLRTLFRRGASLEVPRL